MHLTETTGNILAELKSTMLLIVVDAEDGSGTDQDRAVREACAILKPRSERYGEPTCWCG